MNWIAPYERNIATDTLIKRFELAPSSSGPMAALAQPITLSLFLVLFFFDLRKSVSLPNASSWRSLPPRFVRDHTWLNLPPSTPRASSISCPTPQFDYLFSLGKRAILTRRTVTNEGCCAILPKRTPFGWGLALLTPSSDREQIISLRLGTLQQNISQVLLWNFEHLKSEIQISLGCTTY